MPSEIKKTLISMLLFSRWLGLSPVKWESLQLRVSKGFATLMTREAFTLILAWIQNEDIDVEDFSSELVFKELILFGYLVLKGPQRMAIMIEVLDQLEKIKEKRFRCTLEKKEKKKFYYFIVSLTIFLVIVYINKYIFEVYDEEQPILDNVKSFMLTFFIRYACAISEFYFVLLALLIHTLLASINDDLEEIFKDNVPPSNVILYKEPVSVLGNRDISPTIDCFGLTPAGTFGASMALVAFTLHNIIVAVTTGIQLMLFVEPSYRAQVELRKTTLLVSRALNEALERNDLDQLNELRHLLKMLHLNRPVYSAFGVFNIGRPLVTAVLSGTATILVMLP
ncbi:unnamed protein product [Pieris macdunnoughi]|uniref:Gustatory receptor n=1 Tax=Pieris macdunnoughi TaxID=345717 RepID=A0A821U9K8_9NEOP|nr:unnamed protein product [Pieris macdunnoughi]